MKGAKKVTFCNNRIDCISLSVKSSTDSILTLHSGAVPPRYSMSRKNTEIKSFSQRSAMRLLYAARSLRESAKWFVTLTYPENYPMDGRVIQAHFNAICRRWKRDGIAWAIWWKEFQKRGAPHYHVILYDKPDKAELSKDWFEIVGSGDEKHLRAGTRVEEIRSTVAGYVASYAKKLTQKKVPEGFKHVGRFWGISTIAKKKSEEKNFIVCAPKAVLDKIMAPIKRLIEWKGKKYHGEKREWQVGSCYLWGISADRIEKFFSCYTLVRRGRVLYLSGIY